MHSASIIVFLIILSLVCAFAAIILGNIFSVKVGADENKNDAESDFNKYCNMPDIQENEVFWNSEYYIIALIFLLYVAQIMLFLPMALAFSLLMLYVFCQVLIVFSIILFGFFYVLKMNLRIFK